MLNKLFALTVTMVVCANALGAEDEKDFTPIFNGKNLEGWQGATDGYYVEDEAIVCKEKGGGFLFTNNEYGDFVLRFEFRLTPGANNGIGIRAPREGNPAFAGMEIQVLDDESDHYKGIAPWQAHGSVYGVAAAKRGFLKPAGEWNQEEITANGRQITVKLNGETIVDVNLDEAAKPQTLDGKDHPGLKRDKGHIVFCGHGSRVDYRNLRVKMLNEKASQ